MSTSFVQEFRKMLDAALSTIDEGTRKPLGDSIGVYAFYDYDDEPIYVGQTREKFRTRIGRHLTGQRSDTIAYRILDPFEVASMRLWPVKFEKEIETKQKISHINILEYSVYLDSIDKSKYKAILNEKIPPASARRALPKSFHFNLIAEDFREEREHPDVRIARRAETLSRVAAVAHERGEVSAGLRRVIVMQAIRLADLAAARLAFAEGRRGPSPSAINVQELVGNVRKETLDEDEE